MWDAVYLRSDNSMFTDGIPLFKSSKISLWPVYFIILNLPPSIQSKSKNIILSGLWVGPAKLPIQHLFKPLTEQIDHLINSGLSINLPNGSVTIKAKIVLSIFDLPAKALVLSCKQFNGKFGCTVCLHPGSYVSRRRVYPPTSYELRTHKSILSLAQKASRCGKAVKGIKGIFPDSILRFSRQHSCQLHACSFRRSYGSTNEPVVRF